jgi:hypothetical protein
MDDQGMAPTLRERVSSSVVTVLACVVVGVAATLVLGLAVWLLQVAFGITVPLEAGFPADTVSSVGALRPANVPPPAGTAGFGIAMWVLVMVLVWLTSCRGGIGTPGDAVMTLRPLEASGARASRGRIMARTGVPVAVYTLAVIAGFSTIGLILLAALWAPALVRSDRRTAVDLLVGVVPRSLAPAKTGRSWPAQPADESAPRS